MKKKSVLVRTLLLVLVLAAAGSLPAFAQGSAPESATLKSLSTNYTVMNLSAASATVHVDYMKGYNGTTPGGPWTASAGNTDFTLAAGTSKVVAQYLDATLTAGAGSATISSDQPTAAIVNQLARGQVPSSGSYTAFQDGANSFFMPFAMKNAVSSVGNQNSQIIIMNVGSAATTVNVHMIKSDGTETTVKTITNLPAGESFLYDQANEPALPNNWYGSAKVEAGTGGLVAAVGNEFTGPNGLLTYQGFAAGGSNWVVPIFFSRNANGWNSILAIQNVGTGTIPIGGITVNFALTSGPLSVSNPAAVPANGAWIINPRNNATFPVDAYGPATISATGYSVVAIVNQLKNNTPATTGDNAMSFNAIPANLTGTKVIAPLILSRNDNGYSTVFTVANLTSNAGTCNFVYTPSSGAAITVNNVPLPSNGSIVQNHRLATGASNPLPANWYGSAAVTCTQPVGGVVNELQSLNTGGDPDMSYNAFTVAP